MTKDKGITRSRERYIERLKTKYPDKEFADEEALFSQINDDYDEYDDRITKYQEQEKTLTDLFSSDPRSAAFLTDWRNGEDPIVGLVRKFGDDFKAALEDPEKQEALAEVSKEYAERIVENEKFEEEYQKNINDTLVTLDQMQQEEGLTDEEIDSAMDFLIGIMRDGLLGKFTRWSITMALKAIKHDIDVEQADREGEVRGRNTKIEEKLRKNKNGDGIPALNGKNGVSGEKRAKTVFDLAQEAM